MDTTLAYLVLMNGNHDSFYTSIDMHYWISPADHSRHPDLNQYTQDISRAVAELVLQQILDKVYIIVIDSSGKPLERFTLEVSYSSPGTTGESSTSMMDYFRAMILRAQLCASQLHTPSQGE
ncbi:MAD2 mitotic arrest deficient-like 2 [Dispira simplex]|nr:MAD2 mitotic arrest deficient-like 2 [Dispira simplex]